MIRERVLKRETVENEASRVLDLYLRDYGGSLKLPVDVDIIGELVFGLCWEWDIIEDTLIHQGQTEDNQKKSNNLIILAGLYPRQRKVVMNELHVDLFNRKPGLERFTKGHEIGHWVLHIDKDELDYPSLFDMVEGNLDPYNTVICRDGDNTWIERQANWFSAGLLMPKTIFIDAASRVDLNNWHNHYELAERFGVTISALGTRLNRFGLSYVDEQGQLHRSVSEAYGQKTLM